MISITYKQSSGGRSGHKFSEIFSVFIFKYLLDIDCKIIHNTSWSKQYLLPYNNLKCFSSKMSNDHDYIYIIDEYKKWEGISYKIFTNIKEKIINLNKKYKNILIILTNVCKIIPHNLIFWYNNNLINENIYYSKIIPLLKNIYFMNKKDIILNKISIHIRCGDLRKKLHDIGFTYKYYENIVNSLSENTKYPIHIYCENINYEFLNNLKKIERVKLFPGGTNKLENHIYNLICSKILILSPSSLSLYAGYINNKNVFVDYRAEQFRKNLFHKSEIIFNVFKDVKDILNSLK